MFPFYFYIFSVLEDIMIRRERNFHPNKTYKIHAFHSNLFHACLSVFERDFFTESLIKNYFDFEEISEIERYNKAELFEMMVLNLKRNKDIILRSNTLYNHNRILELEKMYIKQKREGTESDWRIVFNVRISKQTKELVEELSNDTETIGEVIEMAIIYFITICSEQCFEIIKFSFISQFSEE